jgi:transposase
MAEQAATPCPGCQRLQEQLDATRGQIEALQAAVARLQEQLASARKDSSTSSKPPSSDIVKPPPPPPPPGQSKRSVGGQPGHPKHERALFPPEQIDPFFEHPLSGCPCCGGQLHRNGGLVQIVQQIDVEPTKWTIEQHTCPEYWCVHGERSFKAVLPEHIVKGGMVGPRLTMLIAYLKGFCHASFSTIRKFLRDVAPVTISRGQLCKIIGKRMWTWCFRASLFTLFKIDPTRSGDVLIEVLGKEFDGVLGCDCFSAYRRCMREFGVTLQFCLAQLIRDVKFLMTLPGKKDQAYGTRLRDALRALFGVIHQREQMSASEFQTRLEAARDRVLLLGSQDVPASRHAQAMAKRLATHGKSYFTFVTTPDVQPTNNRAEQAIRFVVIDRHITQGTRSEGGQR